MPEVSVIIVNWNGKHLLPDCLDAVFNQTFKDFEVILVDNGSKDGSCEFVEQEYSKVKIVSVEKNYGFAAGNNLGIMVSQGKYIALLNNDAQPDREWLSELVKAAEGHNCVGMFASKIIGLDGKIDSAGCRLYPDGIGVCIGRGQEHSSFYEVMGVTFPSGCAAFYKWEMIKEIGVFDQRFFMYCEDTDLGLRAQRAGWRCLYIPTAVVKHLYSQSSSKWSLKKAFYVERNRLFVMWKNFTVLRMICSVPYTFIRYYRIITRGMAWSS